MAHFENKLLNNSKNKALEAKDQSNSEKRDEGKGKNIALQAVKIIVKIKTKFEEPFPCNQLLGCCHCQIQSRSA